MQILALLFLNTGLILLTINLAGENKYCQVSEFESAQYTFLHSLGVYSTLQTAITFTACFLHWLT